MPKLMTYTVEVPDAPVKEGEGKPRRHVLFAEKLVQYPDEIRSMYENFQRGVSISKDKPFLGTRQMVAGVAMNYEWQTYGQVAGRVKNLSAGFSKRGLGKDANVGLFSINRAEWVIAEQACFYQSMVTVPLYDTLGPDAIEYIITQTEMSLVVATSDKAKIVVEIASKVPSVKYLVIMDGASQELIETAKAVNIEAISIQDLEAEGAKTPTDPIPPKPEDIATICYTSGTTGLPKGVILTHANFLSFGACAVALMSKNHMYPFSSSDVHISYLPLAHVFERVVQLVVVYVGASIGFYQGDTLKLMDDVAVLKPSVFASVPRVYNRIYDKVLAGVKAKGGIAAALFNKGFAAKKEGLKNGTVTHWLWDRLVFNKVRARLGGNVRVMLTGAAPISAEVLDFLRICFSAELYEGYGQTETAAALSVSDRFDLQGGHNGAPLPCCEVKLVDVPSMGYTSSDQPFPRGEICVRGYNVFKGYFKLDDKTKETIDADGWCHTGDIGLWDDKGRLKIVDRVKNIFKLAQGEYVAPEKVENVYARHELVAQIFIYGDSLQSTLVAIVIPDEDVFKPWVKSQGFGEKSFAEHCQDPEVRKAVLKSLDAYAKATELKGFEMAKNIHLHHEMFSVDNGLFTPTFKLKRHEAKKNFQKDIDAMYAALGAKA